MNDLFLLLIFTTTTLFSIKILNFRLLKKFWKKQKTKRSIFVVDYHDDENESIKTNKIVKTNNTKFIDQIIKINDTKSIIFSLIISITLIIFSIIKIDDMQFVVNNLTINATNQFFFNCWKQHTIYCQQFHNKSKFNVDERDFFDSLKINVDKRDFFDTREEINYIEFINRSISRIFNKHIRVSSICKKQIRKYYQNYRVCENVK